MNDKLTPEETAMLLDRPERREEDRIAEIRRKLHSGDLGKPPSTGHLTVAVHAILDLLDKRSQ